MATIVLPPGIIAYHGMYPDDGSTTMVTRMTTVVLLWYKM